MTNSTGLVKKYFNKEAERFDAIYNIHKPAHQRLVDGLFRAVVVERFNLICNLAPLPGDWSVLDVGCGPGRYSIELARRGAQSVLGVDISPQMVSLAEEMASKTGLEDKCKFTTSNFLSCQLTRKYEAVIATGYFDYLENPFPDLKKMVDSCNGRIFASFPKRMEARVTIRKLRFMLEGGYVRFYSKGEVLNLFEQAGVSPSSLSLVDLGRDYIAVATCF